VGNLASYGVLHLAGSMRSRTTSPNSYVTCRAPDNHLSKLCRLVAEHGYRVVLIDGGGADPSAAQYVVIDLADDDGQSGELWGSTPCGLDAIVDHLAALVWDLWDTDERLANLFGEDSGPGG
jgi:hypothetical protein